MSLRDKYKKQKKLLFFVFYKFFKVTIIIYIKLIKKNQFQLKFHFFTDSIPFPLRFLSFHLSFQFPRVKTQQVRRSICQRSEAKSFQAPAGPETTNNNNNASDDKNEWRTFAENVATSFCLKPSSLSLSLSELIHSREKKYAHLSA